jgi:hypothetical protein
MKFCGYAEKIVWEKFKCNIKILLVLVGFLLRWIGDFFIKLIGDLGGFFNLRFLWMPFSWNMRALFHFYVTLYLIFYHSDVLSCGDLKLRNHELIFANLHSGLFLTKLEKIFWEVT